LRAQILNYTAPSDAWFADLASIPNFDFSPHVYILQNRGTEPGTFVNCSGSTFTSGVKSGSPASLEAVLCSLVNAESRAAAATPGQGPSEATVSRVSVPSGASRGMAGMRLLRSLAAVALVEFLAI
jgi:hypothetical protein